MSAAQCDEFVKALSPYLLIIALDGKIGIFGEVTYKSEKVVRSNIRVMDSNGTFCPPLSNDRIDRNTQILLSIFKPVLANMLGPMRKNMKFYLFLVKNKNVDNIADAKKEGAVSVKLDENVFKWKLPLGSLLKPKRCPINGEKLNGAWKFCPWHGVELNY